MNQPIHYLFGTSEQRVERALTALRNGHGVLVTDDEDRENEGDMIYSAEFLTKEQMALLIREGSGIVCLCLPEEKVKQLQLPMMVQENNSQYGTALYRQYRSRPRGDHRGFRCRSGDHCQSRHRRRCRTARSAQSWPCFSVTGRAPAEFWSGVVIPKRPSI